MASPHNYTNTTSEGANSWLSLLSSLRGGPSDIRAASPQEARIMSTQFPNGVSDPNSPYMKAIGAQVPTGFLNTSADTATTGAPTDTPNSTFVGPLTPRGFVQTNGAMSDKTRANSQKQNNTVFKKNDELKKKMAEYQAKREALAIDSQARMNKLQSQFNNQGPDLSGIAMVADASNRGGPSVQNAYNNTAYAKSMMSPQQLEALKQKINQQLQGNYSSMTNSLYNQQTQQNLADYRKQATLDKATAAVQGDGLKAPTEGILKRADNIRMMDMGVTKMKSLSDAGGSEKWGTFFAQNNTLLGDTKFGVALRMASEGYSRMQSGGAVQADEDKRFIMSMFKPNDSASVRAEKFKMLRNLINDRKGSIKGVYKVKFKDYSSVAAASDKLPTTLSVEELSKLSDLELKQLHDRRFKNNGN